MNQVDDREYPNNWGPLMQEFQRRVAIGRAMGGATKLDKRTQTGRPNARALIQLLVDQDSFMELGTLVAGMSYHGEAIVPADGLVAGMAAIDGRPVLIGVEDFTVQGGSIGHGTNAKRVRMARLAAIEQVPYILVLDGAGARVSNSLDRYPYSPNDMIELARLSGQVPIVALVLGSSAGHGAITGLLADYVIALEDATMFAAGPPLVAAATGEIVTKEQLGSARMHASRSGVIHNVVADANAGCDAIRDYLSYFPDSSCQHPPRSPNNDDKLRYLDEIFSILPANAQTPYDIKKLIVHLVDEGIFHEFQPLYGRSMVTGFARLGAHSVALVANQPQFMAGSITHDAAEKAAHFIELANAFHLPVIFLADNPGIMSGTQAEQDGTLRSAARMYAAQANLTSPKLHVTLRKAFGFGSSLMASNPFDEQTLTLALPGISLSALPASGGSEAAGLDEDAARQLAEAETSGAWSTGDTMAYDEIIDPGELRNALLKGLQLGNGRYQRVPQPVLRGGIFP